MWRRGVDGVKEATNVRIEHPVHLPPQDPHIECIQRIVWVTPRSGSIGEAFEVGLVDGLDNLRRRALNDLVFQHRNADRRRRPSDFGVYTRLTGFAWYAPLRSRWERS